MSGVRSSSRETRGGVMQIFDFERRLDDLEFRIAAHGFGEGFCDCGEGTSYEHVELLMGGRLGQSAGL